VIRHAAAVGSLVAPVALVAAALSALGPELQTSVITALVNLVVVVGLYVFIGNSGVVSLGHIGFMAIGAYVGALTTMSVDTKALLVPDLPGPVMDLHLPFLAGVLLAAAAAAVVAAVAALPLARLNGLAAGIATFLLLLIIREVLRNWAAVGSSGTLSNIPVSTTVWSALACAALAIAVAYAFQQSRIGLQLRATREDAPAARALGIGVIRERWIAFVLSAAIVGAAGALYAAFLGSITVDAFYLSAVFVTLSMLVVGGVGSLTGVVAGTAVVSVITECLGRLQDGRGLGPIHLGLRAGVLEMTIAALTVLILLKRSNGLLGDFELWNLRSPDRRSRP
jgi:branched-chain amino acid transport system permease protein